MALLKQAVQIYKRRLPTFLTIQVIQIFPFLLAINQQISISIRILSFCLVLFFDLMLILAINDENSHQEIPIYFKKTIASFLDFSILIVLSIIPLFLWVGVTKIITIFPGLLPPSIAINLFIFGYLGSIIFGAFVVFRLIFSPFIFIREQANILDALKKSWHYTRGKTGKLFADLLPLTLISLLLHFIPVIGLILEILVMIPLIHIVLFLLYKTLQPKREK